MDRRQPVLILVLLPLFGCGNPGPRPQPGDAVHVEFFAQTLAVPQEAPLTLRFQAEAPGGSERVLLLADRLEPLAQPQLTVRFYRDEKPLDRELVLPLKREC